MKPRQNKETAHLIDVSINVLRSHGFYIAARLLCEAGIPPETAFRVLHQPARRRIHDNCVTH